MGKDEVMPPREQRLRAGGGGGGVKGGGNSPQRWREKTTLPRNREGVERNEPGSLCAPAGSEASSEFGFPGCSAAERGPRPGLDASLASPGSRRGSLRRAATRDLPSEAPEVAAPVCETPWSLEASPVSAPPAIAGPGDMAAVLQQVLERAELNKLPKSVQNKLEKFLADQQSEIDGLKGRHEKFKVESGECDALRAPSTSPGPQPDPPLLSALDEELSFVCVRRLSAVFGILVIPFTDGSPTQPQLRIERGELSQCTEQKGEKLDRFVPGKARVSSLQLWSRQGASFHFCCM